MNLETIAREMYDSMRARSTFEVHAPWQFAGLAREYWLLAADWHIAKLKERTVECARTAHEFRPLIVDPSPMSTLSKAILALNNNDDEPAWCEHIKFNPEFELSGEHFQFMLSGEKNLMFVCLWNCCPICGKPRPIP